MSTIYKDHLPNHPTCEWCILPAQYDFVSDSEEWRYGCLDHWLKNRRSKTLGPGHGINLEKGRKPPPRPAGHVAGAPMPPRLAKPVERPAASQNGSGTTLGGSGPRPPRVPRAKGPQEFTDMEPGDVKAGYEPRPGSTIAVALELTEREAGCTLEELQVELDKLGKHDALKLLQFMHTGKGFGFKRQEDGTIRRWTK